MKTKILSLVVFLGVLLSCSQEKTGGLALYTVRDAMQENPKETLKEVAAVGYKNIEAAGYDQGTFYGMSPVDFKAYTEGLGLNPLSAHQSSVTLENANAMMADVRACLLYTSPSPRDQRGSRMPSSA